MLASPDIWCHNFKRCLGLFDDRAWKFELFCDSIMRGENCGRCRILAMQDSKSGRPNCTIGWNEQVMKQHMKNKTIFFKISRSQDAWTPIWLKPESVLQRFLNVSDNGVNSMAVYQVSMTKKPLDIFQSYSQTLNRLTFLSMNTLLVFLKFVSVSSKNTLH